MTEQPPSAAMELLSVILPSCGRAGICRLPPCACAESIDALIAQRVSAETERCALAARGAEHSQCGHGDGYMDGRLDAEAAIRARAERPAPEGPQPHDYNGLICNNCGQKYGSLISTFCPAAALASRGEQPDLDAEIKQVLREGEWLGAQLRRDTGHDTLQDRALHPTEAPPPAAAGGYTNAAPGDDFNFALHFMNDETTEHELYLDEFQVALYPEDRRISISLTGNQLNEVRGLPSIQSRIIVTPPGAVGDYTERARELLRTLHCWRLLYHDARPIDDPDVGQIAAALNEVASGREAAAIRAFGQRVWSDGEEVAYQAGLSDTRARLQEPDEELVLTLARVICPQRWSYLNAGEEETEKARARAALTKIAEMLTVSEFHQYRRTQIAEMADWEPGFDMTGVSVSEPDRQNGSPKLGDKIARNPANHADKWLVAAEYFNANFEPLT